MQTPSILNIDSVEHVNVFDSNDLLLRWQKARIASIVKTLGEDQYSLYKDRNIKLDENHLLLMIHPEQHELLLKNVFDYSRKLGSGFSRYFKQYLFMNELESLLKKSSSPCMSGKWENRENTLVLRRNGCALSNQKNYMLCSYWREAVDGFVMGACKDERFVRHESVVLGDSQCVDVIYKETADPINNQLRFAKIPADLDNQLSQIVDEFLKQKIVVKFLGISESKIFYKMESAEGPLCGPGGKLIHNSLKRKVSAVQNLYQLQDVSPVAVYGSGT